MLQALKEDHKLMYISRMNNHSIGLKIWLKKEEFFKIKLI
jgi:hypothetical protein